VYKSKVMLDEDKQSLLYKISWQPAWPWICVPCQPVFARHGPLPRSVWTRGNIEWRTGQHWQDWSRLAFSEGLPYPRLKQEVCGWYTSYMRCAGFKEFGH
jgi:hypothetical protein